MKKRICDKCGKETLLLVDDGFEDMKSLIFNEEKLDLCGKCKKQYDKLIEKTTKDFLS